MSLQVIQELLRDAYDYFIVPKANGLVDMRASNTEFKKKVSEIDFVNLVGNEYGIFSKLAFKQIPKPKIGV